MNQSFLGKCFIIFCVTFMTRVARLFFEPTGGPLVAPAFGFRLVGDTKGQVDGNYFTRSVGPDFRELFNVPAYPCHPVSPTPSHTMVAGE